MSRPTYILGINAVYHDMAACLLRDGVLVAAIEEERLTRIKHGKSARIDNADVLPEQAIRYCLEAEKISLQDVAHIGYSFLPKLRLQNIGADVHTVEGGWGSKAGELAFTAGLERIPERLAALAGTALTDRLLWLPHHLCHAASAYLASPFQESAVLAVDGIGEFATTWFGHGIGRRIKPVKEIYYPHSLGFLWEKLSQFLGFTEYDASKIMGLASYGDWRRFYAPMQQLVTLREPGDIVVASDILRFRVPEFAPLEALFGVKRLKDRSALGTDHEDIAAALQKITDESMVHFGRYLRTEVGSRRLSLAGGVALNCVANYALMNSGLFDEIYIQPAASDAGTALGAALLAWTAVLGQERSFVMDHPYWGPEFSESEVERALRSAGLSYERQHSVEPIVAKLLAAGNIVGWFDGRAEWGPRALGHRSLLADPRCPDMKDTLNRRIKQRESFRPFAPSVLSEHAAEWFEIPSACSSISTEFMEFTFPVRSSRRSQIPAITHVDGTSRVQLVDRKRNPRYHALIQAFYDLTGVPMLLNTSFNENEPIVCSPSEAIETFLRTRMDTLVLGNFLTVASNAKGQDAAVAM